MQRDQQTVRRLRVHSAQGKSDSKDPGGPHEKATREWPRRAIQQTVQASIRGDGVKIPEMHSDHGPLMRTQNDWGSGLKRATEDRGKKDFSVFGPEHFTYGAGMEGKSGPTVEKQTLLKEVREKPYLLEGPSLPVLWSGKKDIAMRETQSWTGQ